MKVIIAEKPSVAREIAAIVGAKTKKEGYMEGNDYAVTWAFGHLITLVLPEEYGIIGFRRENLPILPKTFIIKPRQVKAEKGYISDPGALKQLNIIKDLFNKSQQIIVATDAGREGELIFRFIYNYLGCSRPFQRLWISSLTDKAIQEGLQNLRPGSDYDNLYQSAKARSEADWLVGINASQALTIAAGRRVYSLGRVQTPTLAMICSRYLENKDFVPATYFQLKLHTEKETIPFTALSALRYDEHTAADDARTKVMSAAKATITSVECKEVTQEPPLLYDLTTLQKEANSKHGFSADKTLTLAQALYEKKVISYPRTGSRYISADVLDEIPHLIDNLKSHPRFGTYATTMDNKTLNIRSVDDKKITDHHALIITENTSGNLSPDEEIIYEMIAGRLLESFSARCTKENTVVSIEADSVHFTAKSSIILVPGWRSVFGTPDEEKEDTDTILPPGLKDGENLPVKDCELQEKQTKPRPIHTESSLLGAMEAAGKELANEEEREAMKDAGIGTPATRASIIETLFSREYVIREKKSLVPTDKGLAVYEVVKDKKIADVSMTGHWEHALSKIEHGEMNPVTFHNEIEVYTAQVTTELLEAIIESTGGRSGCPCPKCKSGQVVFYPKVAKCQNADCGLMVFRTIAGKELSDFQLTDLLIKGKTPVIKGFKSKVGKSFDAAISLDDEYKTTFAFEERPKGKKTYPRK